MCGSIGVCLDFDREPLLSTVVDDGRTCLRYSAGGNPNSRLNAQMNAASASCPTSKRHLKNGVTRLLKTPCRKLPSTELFLAMLLRRWHPSRTLQLSNTLDFNQITTLEWRCVICRYVLLNNRQLWEVWFRSFGNHPCLSREQTQGRNAWRQEESDRA